MTNERMSDTEYYLLGGDDPTGTIEERANTAAAWKEIRRMVWMTDDDSPPDDGGEGCDECQVIGCPFPSQSDMHCDECHRFLTYEYGQTFPNCYRCFPIDDMDVEDAIRTGTMMGQTIDSQLSDQIRRGGL